MHTRKAACVLGRCCAIGFFRHMIIPSYDWLVIHVKTMASIFIYNFLQPFDVVGCAQRVTICRVVLYADFIKSRFRAVFLESAYMQDRLICEDIRYIKIYAKFEGRDCLYRPI